MSKLTHEFKDGRHIFTRDLCSFSVTADELPELITAARMAIESNAGNAKAPKPKLTPKQAKMRDTVAYLKEYMRTYDEQPGYLNYSDATLIDDVLYGLGVAFDREHVGASGYGVFKDRLREHLGPKAPLDALRIAIPLMRRKGYSVEANQLEIFIADIVERLETPARHP